MLGHYSRREEDYLPSTGLSHPGYLEKRFTFLINPHRNLLERCQGKWEDRDSTQIHVAA